MALPDLVFNHFFLGNVKKELNFIKVFQKFEVWVLGGSKAVEVWWPGLWWCPLTEDGSVLLSCPPGWD